MAASKKHVPASNRTPPVTPRTAAPGRKLTPTGKGPHQDRQRVAVKGHRGQTDKTITDGETRHDAQDRGRPSHPGDSEADKVLADALIKNAGSSALYRHREHVTGTENEEDGVPEDEDTMEDAAQEELDDEPDTKAKARDAHDP